MQNLIEKKANRQLTKKLEARVNILDGGRGKLLNFVKYYFQFLEKKLSDF